MCTKVRAKESELQVCTRGHSCHANVVSMLSRKIEGISKPAVEPEYRGKTDSYCMRRGCNGEASVHPTAFHPLPKSPSGTTTVLIVLGKAALSSGEVSSRARNLLSPGLLQALRSAREGAWAKQGWSTPWCACSLIPAGYHYGVASSVLGGDHRHPMMLVLSVCFKHSWVVVPSLLH